MSWVFQVFTNLVTIKDDPSDPSYIWKVGFYDPDGAFIMAYQVPTQSAAADLVHYLNGGSDSAIRDFHDAFTSEPVEVSGYITTLTQIDS
jgi:hypothetical protein